MAEKSTKLLGTFGDNRLVRMMIQGLLVVIAFICLVALKGFFGLQVPVEVFAFLAAALENWVKPVLNL